MITASSKSDIRFKKKNLALVAAIFLAACNPGKYATDASVAVGSDASPGTAVAAEETWNDGVLFVDEEISSLEGHTAFRIVFGLEPGVCTDELVAVSEWLKMREGVFSLTYSDTGDVERVAGDEWYQPSGTRVILCNRSDQNAILTGVQFRPE